VNTIDFNRLWPEIRIGSERVLSGLGMLFLFWIAAKISEQVICRIRHRMPHNAGLLQLLGRTTKIAILVFGAATALGTMGVNVAALVAGLGLTGFALGFAFRDILSNLLAGVMLLLFRPFAIDDQISVTGLEGRVAKYRSALYGAAAGRQDRADPEFELVYESDIGDRQGGAASGEVRQAIAGLLSGLFCGGGWIAGLPRRIRRRG
jgi:hypothetical protein